MVTPRGEIGFRIVADARTGVIDMYGGPDPEQMAFWPSRVVERPAGGSLHLFAILQQPGMADAAFDAQFRGFAEEIAHVRQAVDGAAAAGGTATDALDA